MTVWNTEKKEPREQFSSPRSFALISPRIFVSFIELFLLLANEPNKEEEKKTPKNNL